MLLSDDPAPGRAARFLSTQAREPVAHYEHRHVGYNYRLSNVLAALGRAQLARLDSMIARRRDIRGLRRGGRRRPWHPGVRRGGRRGRQLLAHGAGAGPRPAPVDAAQLQRSSRQQISKLGRCGSRCICSRSSPRRRAWIVGA